MANNCSNTLTITCDKKHKKDLQDFKLKVSDVVTFTKKELKGIRAKFLADNKAEYVKEQRLADFTKHSTMPMKKFFEQVMQYSVNADGSASVGSYFSLNALVPCPEELCKVTAPVRAENGENNKEFKARVKRHIELYGYSSSYDWVHANWGTKWADSYDEEPEEGETTLVYHFDSAWAPPLMWMKEVSSKFPNLSFNLEYSEPGCGFQGTAEAIEGELSDHCEDYVPEDDEEDNDDDEDDDN